MTQETRTRTLIAVARVIAYSLAAIGFQTGFLLRLDPDAGNADLALTLMVASVVLAVACWAGTRYLTRFLPVDSSRPHTLRQWMQHLSAADPYAPPLQPLPIEQVSPDEQQRRELAGRRAVPLAIAYPLGAFAVCLAFVTPISAAVIVPGAVSAILIAIAFGLILPPAPTSNPAASDRRQP